MTICVLFRYKMVKLTPVLLLGQGALSFIKAGSQVLGQDGSVFATHKVIVVAGDADDVKAITSYATPVSAHVR